MSSEATSYDEEEAELELGLGLSIGGGRPGSDAGKPKQLVANNTTAANTTTVGRIFTAKDFPCAAVSSSSRAVSGTKRNADSVSRDGGSSPPRVSQVVGWPPIRASRMYSLVNQAKTPRSEDQDGDNNKVVVSDKDKPKEALKKNANNVGGFVKVNIDGIAIGRKVDLNAHSCYESLAQTLEDMFFGPGSNSGSNGDAKEQGTKASKLKLLDGSSEFVLTYEDKDGDWMLVGDVPWRMFLGSVKRLRIMRTSEATGLAPRFHERNERQRIKPI